jgi:hypothetical protein
VITLTTAQRIATYCRVHTTKQDTVSNNKIYNQWLTIQVSLHELLHRPGSSDEWVVLGNRQTRLIPHLQAVHIFSMQLLDSLSPKVHNRKNCIQYALTSRILVLQSTFLKLHKILLIWPIRLSLRDNISRASSLLTDIICPRWGHSLTYCITLGIKFENFDNGKLQPEADHMGHMGFNIMCSN